MSSDIEDQIAFREHCRVIAASVRRYSEDSVQEVALHLLAGGDPESAARRAANEHGLRNPVRMISLNEYLGASYNDRPVHELGEVELTGVGMSPGEDATPIEVSLERAGVVSRAIGRIPEPMRSVVRAYWGIESEKLSVGQIAERHGVRESTIFEWLGSGHRAVSITLRRHGSIPWTESQLDELKPEEREALEMRFERGLSASNIAKALGVSVGTIERRIREARKKIETAAKASVARDAEAAKLIEQATPKPQAVRLDPGVRKLSVRDQMIMQLRYVERMSIENVAKRASCSISTAGSVAKKYAHLVS